MFCCLSFGCSKLVNIREGLAVLLKVSILSKSLSNVLTLGSVPTWAALLQHLVVLRERQKSHSDTLIIDAYFLPVLSSSLISHNSSKCIIDCTITNPDDVRSLFFLLCSTAVKCRSMMTSFTPLILGPITLYYVMFNVNDFCSFFEPLWTEEIKWSWNFTLKVILHTKSVFEYWILTP